MSTWTMPSSRSLLTVLSSRTYVRGVGTHAYEAHCQCGATWRVYADENDDDPKGTCVACGADTYDLRDIGEDRASY